MRALPALLALPLLLAGCFGAGAPAEPLARGDVPAAGASGLAAEALEGEAPEAMEALASPGSAWVRAYWGARAEAPLLDGAGPVYALGAEATGCFCVGRRFVPDEGAFVAPGTAALVATADYTPPATMAGSTLRLRATAPSGNATILDVAPGAPVEIPVAPEDADAPLQVSSAWVFALFADPAPAGADPGLGEVRLTVVAQRAEALPLFPMPPDPWGGAAAVTLVEEGAWSGTGVTLMGSACVQCDGYPVWSPPNGTLVPADARRVVATVQWSAPGAKPILTFDAPGAGGPMTLVQDGDAERVYEVDVTPATGDSPYQAVSRWSFSATWETAGQAAAVFPGSLRVTFVALQA